MTRPAPDPESREALRGENEKLRAERDELQALFDLQSTRMEKASALWREAHPSEKLVLPDLGDLLEWLMERPEVNIEPDDVVSLTAAGEVVALRALAAELVADLEASRAYGQAEYEAVFDSLTKAVARVVELERAACEAYNGHYDEINISLAEARCLRARITELEDALSATSCFPRMCEAATSDYCPTHAPLFPKKEAPDAS